MDQIPQPANNQSEDKNIANIPAVSVKHLSSSDFLAQSAASEEVSLATETALNPAININTQHSGKLFKLASDEAQRPKSLLKGGKNSSLVLLAIVSILTFAIAGISGYYLYVKKDETPESVVPPMAVPETTPKVDKKTDSDKDGLPDEVEKKLGTYMTKSDTDGDGFNDFHEIKNGYSPLILGTKGKYTEEQWQAVKDEIEAANKEFYRKEFEAPIAPFPSQSFNPEASLLPSFVPEASLDPNSTVNSR